MTRNKEVENEDTDEVEQEKYDGEQNKVVSNETFRLLLSSQDVNESLHTKASSELQDERVSVHDINFECLDIWP